MYIQVSLQFTTPMTCGRRHFCRGVTTARKYLLSAHSTLTYWSENSVEQLIHPVFQSKKWSGTSDKIAFTIRWDDLLQNTGSGISKFKLSQTFLNKTSLMYLVHFYVI